MVLAPQAVRDWIKGVGDEEEYGLFHTLTQGILGGTRKTSTTPSPRITVSLANQSDSFINIDATRLHWYSNDTRTWMKFAPLPPPPCQTPEKDQNQYVPGVVSMWGPKTIHHSFSALVFQEWDLKVACTVYFFGEKMIRELGDSLLTQANPITGPPVDLSPDPSQGWVPVSRPQPYCKWTGEQVSGGHYWKTAAITGNINQQGVISTPPGFSHCDPYSLDICLSSDKTTYLLIRHPPEKSSLCASLEMKLVAAGAVSQDKSGNAVVSIPRHHLSYFIPKNTSSFSCSGHQIIVSPSGHLISVSKEAPNSTSSRPYKAFWKSLNSDDPPHYDYQENGWMVVNQIPIQPDFTSAELFHGLLAVSERDSSEFQMSAYLSCLLKMESWHLAKAIMHLNPTPIARISSGHPFCLGAVDQGNFYLLFPHLVKSVIIHHPLQRKGDWVLGRASIEGQVRDVWIQSLTGVVMDLPSPALMSSLGPIYLPLLNGKYVDVTHPGDPGQLGITNYSPGVISPEVLSTISLGSMYVPHPQSPSPGSIDAAASLSFLDYHLRDGRIPPITGLDGTDISREVGSAWGSLFSWWTTAKHWFLLIFCLVIAAFLLWGVVKLAPLCRKREQSTPEAPIIQMGQLMKDINEHRV
uniref:Glycoprotein n=1 Tax=Quarantine head virus TaxID=2485877 RepID=A0A3G3BTP3_9VIRU|nr:glycoprotein [Quarantine head virus]